MDGLCLGTGCVGTVRSRFQMARQASSSSGPSIDWLTALNDLGLCLMAMGRLHEAAEVLKEAVQKSPQSLQSRGNLAIVLRECGEGSLPSSTGSPAPLKTHPLSARFAPLGRSAEALEHAQAAATLAPRDPRVLYNLALILRQEAQDGGGDEAEARAKEYLHAALDLEPDLHPAWSTLGHMAGKHPPRIGERGAAGCSYSREWGKRALITIGVSASLELWP
jgi:tetratricopeptide (TPR) repeat protein